MTRAWVVMLFISACTTARSSQRLVVYSVTADEPAQLRLAVLEDGTLIYHTPSEGFQQVALKKEEWLALESSLKALHDEPRRIGSTAGEGSGLVLAFGEERVTVLGEAESTIPNNGPVPSILSLPRTHQGRSRPWVPESYVIYMYGASKALAGGRVCPWVWAQPPSEHRSCAMVKISDHPTWSEFESWQSRGCDEFQIADWFLVPVAQPALIGAGPTIPQAACINLRLDKEGLHLD